MTRGLDSRRAERVGQHPSTIQRPQLVEPRGELLPPQDPESAPRVLRVGVVQAGRVIEERLFRERQPVSVGASPRCEITVPAAGLPRRLSLFELVDEQYQLVCPVAVDGRVVLGGADQQVRTLAQAQAAQEVEAEQPRRGRERVRLPLCDRSRGKLTLGEVTLLFQFVTAPPLRPLPQLPPSVRGSFFGQLDLLFAGSWAAAAAAITAFVVVLHGVDFPRNLAPDAVPDGIAQLVPLVDRPTVKLDLARLKKVGEGKLKKVVLPTRDADAAKRKQPRKAAKRQGPKRALSKRPAPPCDASCEAARKALARARLVKLVQREGALQILGVKSKQGGAVRNLLRHGNPGAKADKAYKGIDGVHSTQRGPGLAGKRGSHRQRGPVTLDGLDGRVSGPAKVKTKIKIVEHVPVVRVKREKTKIEPTLTISGVASILRRGVRMVKSCYQRAIKRGAAQGKISVVLTINGLGKVIDVDLAKNSLNLSRVDACVKALARRLRFPPPSDGKEAEISFALVFRTKAN
jgi:hypothetical protein